ncbi:hypothetical protein GCM10009819_07420 [Agromyces tropicus]|uniref:HTH araC/xylS-type domain-containing protein n=1 Tax=Agromyces tropicus TaxID=555371 RepID=A0ABP5FJI8_9MICO
MEIVSVVDRDGWGSAVGRSFYPLSVVTTGERFEAVIRQTQLGRGVRIAEVDCGPNDLLRTRRLLRDSPSDDLLLLVQLEGVSELSQADREVRLAAGVATLCDPLTEYRVRSAESSHQLVILLPREVIRNLAMPISSTRLRPLDPRLVSLRALTSVVGEAMSQGDDLDFAESDAIAGVVVDLARSMLVKATGASRRPRSREELTATALAFIRDHHADPALTPQVLADAVEVSPRALTTLLREHGSPSRLIRDERLRQARAMLADPRFDRDSIGRIALRTGFADQTTFIRAFRRAFDDLPSDVRNHQSV